MRHVIVSLLLMTVSLGVVKSVVAQQAKDDILLTIGNDEVTKDEFVRIYTKNNQDPAFDRESLEEYMELFINFKLKVLEAESLGMDTLPSFKKELNGYKKQLEKPYFSDDSIDIILTKEAYERMKWDIKASHILIKCGENALPEDTLKAYNKIKKIRERAIRGEDFSKLAKQYSDDPSAKSNAGELGYFTAFSMVYPFETAAYNTPVGHISNIIRTRYGYHIIKVEDKREDQGQVQVAHIMRAVPKGSSEEKFKLEKEKIDAVYDSLQAGADFATMAAKYSDDRGTSRKGGVLPYFGVGRMIPEFANTAFSLENIGDYSKPIKTDYGYHIIKLLDKKPLGTYEELEPTIKRKISKDIRAKKGHEIVVNNLKKEYGLKIYKDSLKSLYSVVDSTIYKGTWDKSKAEGLTATLFTIADTNRYTQEDFAEYLSRKGYNSNLPIVVLVDKEFDKFVDKSLMDFERSRLSEKYPDYKNLLQEYHDGILLFNITDENVWSKAIKDTAGLEKFYQEHKNNYMWGERVEATVYTLNKKEYQAKIEKLAVKTGKKNSDPTEMLNKFVEKVKDSTLTVTVEKKIYSKGDRDIIDAVTWEQGSKQSFDRDGSVLVVYVNKVIPPEPKKLSEAKGLITADYQNYLEEEWIKQLREKYPVKVNEDVLNTLVK